MRWLRIEPIPVDIFETNASPLAELIARFLYVPQEPRVVLDLLHSGLPNLSSHDAAVAFSTIARISTLVSDTS